jgi:hypothetical protein
MTSSKLWSLRPSSSSHYKSLPISSKCWPLLCCRRIRISICIYVSSMTVSQDWIISCFCTMKMLRTKDFDWNLQSSEPRVNGILITFLKFI